MTHTGDSADSRTTQGDWLNENNLFAGAKLLLGVDPKKGCRDKLAEVDLR